MSTETTEAGVTVAACDLRRILSDALPFAGRDDPLEVVCLEATGGVLTATATDRYTLGHSRTKAQGEFGQRVVIARSDARRIRRLLPGGTAPYGADKEARLLIDGDTLRVRITVSSSGELGFLAPLSKITFPDYASVVTKVTDAPPGLPIGLGPRFLARFAKIGRRHDVPLCFYIHNSASLVFVEVADSFTGVIMPVRMPQAGDPSEWSAERRVPLGHPVPVQATARSTEDGDPA